MSYILQQQANDENQKIFLITINTMEDQVCLENQYIVCLDLEPRLLHSGNNWKLKRVIKSESETMTLQDQIDDKELLQKVVNIMSMNLSGE